MAKPPSFLAPPTGFALRSVAWRGRTVTLRISCDASGSVTVAKRTRRFGGVAGNRVDWTHTGKGWWRVVHYVWWWNGTAWADPAWADGQHHDYVAPGGGGGGPANLGSTYSYCYVE